MANIRLSNDYINNGYTMLENAFISEFLPTLESNSIKVYLYALLLCNSRSDKRNTVDILSISLGLEISEINRAISELKNNNLIRVLHSELLDFEIVPIIHGGVITKKYKTDKYSDFTRQLQELFPDRMLMPGDYLKYYELIEECKFAPESLVMIASYCIRMKTTKVHHNYILTVAKSWAAEGIITVNDIEAKLQEIEESSDNIRQIFYTLGLKSTPDVDDKQLFLKWTKSWGYEFNSVIATAKLCKKRGGMQKLDALLDQFYKLGIFSQKEIDEHAKYIEFTRSLAISVNKILGVYYENIDNIVTTYITEWLNKGYNEEALLALSGYCFKRSIRSLDGLNSVIDRFYKQGLISLDSINQFIDQSISTDKLIRELLELCGSLRSPKESDRVMYNTWTNIWGMDDSFIKYACELAGGKAQPFSYINQLLSSWKGYKTLEECKAHNAVAPKPNMPGSSKSAHFEGERNYSKEELKSIFGDITDVDNIDF